MKKNLLAVLIASSIGLYGCGDEKELTGNPTIDPVIEQSLQAETKIKFDLVTDPKNPVIVAPTFLAMDPKDGTLVLDGKVGEDGYASELSKIEDGELRTRAALGKTDGWGTTQPFVIEFTGNDLDASTAEDGFYLIESNNPTTTIKSITPKRLTAADNYFKVSASGKKLIVELKKPLNPATDYMFAITDELKDVKGNSVGMTGSYAVLKTTAKPPSEKLAPAQGIVHASEQELASVGIDADSIIFSSWFTTASAGNSLYATKAAMAKAITAIKASENPEHSNAASFVWKNTGLDLTGLYSVTLGEAKDYAEALDDPNFVSDQFFLALAKGDQAIANGIKTKLKNEYNNAAGSPNLKLNVYKGTIKLPYFLEGAKNDQWQTTPWQSALPSLATIKYVLTSDNVSKTDKATIVNQLTQTYKVNIDLLLKGDFDEVAKLIGAKLTLANGDQLDSERLVTKYSPLPQIKSVKDVPILVFVPEGASLPEKLGAMIYQHGITSVKETAFLMAANHMGATAKQEKEPYAIVAIDHPLHGERALITDEGKPIVTTPTTADTYMNLEYLPVARDNIRQSVIDDLGVRAGLEVMSDATDSVLSKFDMSKVSFFGHSLGAISGLSTYATANTPLKNATENEYFKFSAGTFANPGAAIPSLLLNSNTFGGTIKHGIFRSDVGYETEYKTNCEPSKTPGYECFANYYSSLEPSSKKLAEETFQSFAIAAQTVLDTTDPLNLAKNISGPVYLLQAEDDKVVPNENTKLLLPQLKLKSINDTQNGGKYFANFSASYKVGEDGKPELTEGLDHSSVLMAPHPLNDKLYKPWQAVTRQITSFTSNQGHSVNVTNENNVSDTDNGYLVK